ncbi:MAG: hypothetical protein QXW82_05760 [Candidatus Bathyarchaeia archaeon]
MGLVTPGFELDYENNSMQRGGGRVLPYVVIPAGSFTTDIETIRKAVSDEVVNSIVDALTKVMPEGGFRRPAVEKPEERTFIGTLQEINRYFYSKWWTDGLPIIPPTKKAVEEMLQGTDLPRDMELGVMEPRGGILTVETIAINAVMAGCLPIHMPVLIAGMKALLKVTYPVVTASTGSWSRSWIINGPIRKDLNINCRSGAVGPGWLSNSCIGRALGLIVQNTGGARPGVHDMGTLGNPGKYTTVIGENEEESPWTPLHVERGYSKDDSTITFAAPNSYIQFIATTPKDVLRELRTRIMHGLVWPGRVFALIPPENANEMAKAGWTKQDIKRFLVQYTRIPKAKSPLKQMPRERWPKEFEALDDDDLLPVFPNERMIDIVVTGGPGRWIALLGPSVVDVATEKIELPSNWKELVEKYKGALMKET